MGYRMKNVAPPRFMKDKKWKKVYPEDLMDPDDKEEEEDDTDEQTQSTVSHTESTTKVSLRHATPRQFQAGHPQRLSVHRTMNMQRNEQRRINRRHNIAMHLDQLQRKNYRLQQEKERLLEHMHQMTIHAHN